MTALKPGDRITVTAVVESEGHDDQHVIVRIGSTPVQVLVPTASGHVRAQRELAVREYAEALQRAASQVLGDLDRGRVPRLRSALDDANRLAAHIEVLTALESVQEG